ncbi:IS1182 family transposase ISClbu1 [bioreactor metagenome]|uniref:IS1182 family transposase ISClbu1 n=1 Tax=bioreactor metagenome TaxID=1076179 RepID=A0A645AFA9_9ZZZZ
MNTITIQQDYSKFPRNYQLKLCSELDVLLPCDESVRLLSEVVEELNYTKLYRAYSPKGRKPNTSPFTMFKILAYGAMDGRHAGRELERACRRDINYMWLLGNEPAPDHDALNRFRSKQLTEVIEDLFYQLIKKLAEMGEIKYEHLFVDGTKIEANANKYTFVWKKSIGKHQERLQKKMTEFLAELSCRYGWMNTEILPKEAYARLSELKTEPFVHGRGKRKTQLQRDIEQLGDMMQRQEKYGAYNDTFQGRNSFSKTDPDATFMHMKEDHMRNAQLKPGYNVQLAVEGEYITGLDISSERSDQLTLIPLLERMEAHTGHRYGDVTADAGYESEENYTYFENKQQTCYIKPQNYERSKTKKFKSNMSLRENMAYDAEKDEYTCQNGKKLKEVYTGKRVSKSGFESEITYYECENCEGCPHKKNCTRAKGNRKMQLSKTFLRQREQSLHNITSEKGILLRMNRSIQSEGAFGVIKQDYGFRQFLLRGNKKVRTEMLIMAFGYNVNKLHHKIQQNRTGSQLFEKMTA